MTPFGLLRVCSAAALAAGSIGVAMPAAADNKCNVRYSPTEVVFTSCAAEERACEARGFIYGTTKYAQCVAALAGQGMPERRALGFRPATPPAGMRQTPPPSLAPKRQP
jgi:hypothetical protein